MSEGIDVTALVESGNNFLSEILNASDIDKAINLIKKLDVLKSALKAADTFREQSVIYAKLEAAALVKVAELNGTSKLTGKRCKAALWLKSLSEADREKYISLCSDGKTIDNIWWSLFGKAETNDYLLQKAKEKEEKLINELYTNGSCNLEAYNSFICKNFDKRIAADIIDGTRNRIRKIGGYGIKDGNGTYILPSVAPLNEVKKSVSIRFESIAKDIKSICDLINETKAILYEDEKENFTVSRKLTVRDCLPNRIVDYDVFFLSSILFAMVREKVFTEEEVIDFMESEKSNYYKSSSAYQWGIQLSELCKLYENTIIRAW